MDASTIAAVRRFNRTVTQRVGALDDRFLSRDRPLGQARLLWEIGADGAAPGRDVRSLRATLDLDSGYLSRLLRALEADGLVTVEPDDDDRRVRIARLTAAGRAERAMLERGSDELARSLLVPLRPAQRTQLVDAMAQVERLLTAGLVDVAVTDPTHPDATHCLRHYFAELDRRFAVGFDPTRALPVDPTEVVPPSGVMLVARLRDAPVGCGAVKLHAGRGEIKRLWVAPDARGLGLGRRLLAELEQHAVAHGAAEARLDTNSALSEATALYRACGYVEVPAFNAEPHADRWFAKPLTRAPEGSPPA